VLYGQGITPDGYNPIADLITEDDLVLALGKIRAAIRRRVSELPPHDAFIERCCAAPAAAAQE